MAAALAATPGLEVSTSFSTDAEDPRNYSLDNDFPVRTYTSKMQLVLGLPRLLMIALRARQFIRARDVGIVYSGMISIWQSLALHIMVPKTTTYVASIHDAQEHLGERHWLMRFCQWLELRRADVVVTYSSAVQSRIAERGVRAPVIMIPHGIDSPVTSSREIHSGDVAVIGFFGRLVEYKGIDLFVRSIERLREDGYNVRGAVYGNGDFDSSLQESSAPIDWHVGWIEEDEIESIIDTFDVLALPYKEASQSGVFTLAAARAVPCVATPVGGLREQVESAASGVVSESVDAVAFTRAVESILRDPALYQSLSKAALEAAEATSWPQVAKQLMRALHGAALN
jgi:glycosyltransferase involved in cell wall biosynthesis